MFNLEGNFRTNHVVDRPGNTYPSRLPDRLQTRRNVDAVAEKVFAIDNDVSSMNPDAKQHLIRRGFSSVALGQCGLDLGGTIDGDDSTGEFSNDTIAGGTKDPPALRRYFLFRRRSAFFKIIKRPFFILTHHFAEANDIGRQYNGNLPFSLKSAH